jgi:hypothetical protein
MQQLHSPLASPGTGSSFARSKPQAAQLGAMLLMLILLLNATPTAFGQFGGANRPRLYAASAFGDSLVWVRKQPRPKWEAVNPAGNAQFTLRRFADHVKAFGSNRAPVRVKQGWGYVDEQGAFRISPQYKLAGCFVEGRAWVLKEDRFGYIDTTGQYVVAPQYGMAEAFSEGLARVWQDTLWGYVNREGALKIPRRFASAQDFSGGLAAAVPKNDSLWGFIDKSGEWHIAPQYSWVGNFSEGLAAFWADSLYGYLNAAGDTAIPAALR